MNCQCSVNFNVRLGRTTEYKLFHSILNKGRHPAFIGRETFGRNANNGGALLYEFDGEIVAVSLINPRLGILLALNVIQVHRQHGMGAAIIKYLMPNFARVIESKVSWFEKQGYVPIGDLKQGISLKTQVMIRKNLLSLAKNLKKVW